MNSFMNDGSQHARIRSLIVAMDLGGRKVAVARAAMKCSIVKEARANTKASQGAQPVLERTTATARALIERTVAEVGGQCVAVGVATPGVVHDKGVLLSPNIPGWERVSLRETMRANLQI